MIELTISQNKNQNSAGFGKCYARVDYTDNKNPHNMTTMIKQTTRLITLLTVLLLALPVTLWAQTPKQQLVVWLKSGDKVYFDLAELPETSFENGQFIIKTSKTTVYYQFESILRYTFQGVNTSVELLPNERSVSVSQDGDGVTFQNLKAGATVSIYAANGVLMEQLTANGGEPLRCSVANRPSGVYLVKAGNQTIKLLKR